MCPCLPKLPLPVSVLIGPDGDTDLTLSLSGWVEQGSRATESEIKVTSRLCIRGPPTRNPFRSMSDGLEFLDVWCPEEFVPVFSLGESGAFLGSFRLLLFVLL